MTILVNVLLAFAAAAQPTPKPANIFAPISLYQGNWRATAMKPGDGPDLLSNHCHEFGTYYTCQQTVNGKVGALIVFVSAGAPGHFHTQALLPNGRAIGRGDLLIEGSHWTYSSQDTEKGKTTYYRTTNLFHGTDHIHFEISHSADGKTWTADRQGDEDRLPAK